MRAELAVPELRDYRRINAELARLLDAGEPLVRLAGVEGQRLLLHGLAGAWDAVVEVQGTAGPELAAELDAPDLLVVCTGGAADGAGRGLVGGRLLILGDSGAAVAYGLRGGSVIVAGTAGPRAGLNLAGGTLALLGPSGSLAGERQSGGRIYARADGLAAHPGRGRRGGEFLLIAPALEPNPPDGDGSLLDALRGLEPWLGERSSRWRMADA